MRSFIHSFILSFIHSFIHSFFLSFFILSFILSFFLSFLFLSFFLSLFFFLYCSLFLLFQSEGNNVEIFRDVRRGAGNDADAAKNCGGGAGTGSGISGRWDAEPELEDRRSSETRSGTEPARLLVDKEWSRRDFYRAHFLWLGHQTLLFL